MVLIYEVLGDVVIGLHYAFLLYLIVGGFLAARWPRTIVLHAAAAVWGVLIVVAKLDCPLTWAQDRLRELNGQPPLRDGFIQLYVRGIFYPAHAERASQVVVGAVVLTSWVLFWRRARPRAAATVR